MAYTGNPSTVPRDAVRLLVGDISTSTSGEYLADADYTFFIAQTPNIYVAAQLASNSLAALFTGSAASASGSGFVEKSVGDLRLKKADASQMAANYRALAVKFGRMSAGMTAPTAGGISRSDKRAAELDTDRVPPFFTRSQMDNREAVNPGNHPTADEELGQ